MGRGLLFIIYALALAIAGQARALDFLGSGVGMVRFNPPPGFCLLSPSDARFEPLRAGYEASARPAAPVDGFPGARPGARVEVRAIFIACQPEKIPRQWPQMVGYVADLPPQFIRRRSDWVAALRPPPAADGDLVVTDGYDALGFY